MTTIWEKALTALTPLGLPLAASVYVPATGADLPDAYLVYFVVSNPVAQSADNAEKLLNYRLQVSYYTRTGLTTLPAVVTALAAAGFRRTAGRELPYNPDTRHFGWAWDFTYLEEV